MPGMLFKKRIDENVKWWIFSGSNLNSSGLMSDLYIVVVLRSAKIEKLKLICFFYIFIQLPPKNLHIYL